MTVTSKDVKTMRFIVMFIIECHFLSSYEDGKKKSIPVDCFSPLLKDTFLAQSKHIQNKISSWPKILYGIINILHYCTGILHVSSTLNRHNCFLTNFEKPVQRVNASLGFPYS